MPFVFFANLPLKSLNIYFSLVFSHGKFGLSFATVGALLGLVLTVLFNGKKMDLVQIIFLFNVDGSTVGKPDPAGIEGVLRNCGGERLLIFSKSIGLADSNLAEFLAIKEALAIFVSSKWSRSFGLIIESDSLNVVIWFNDSKLLPWRLRKLCSSIDSLKSLVIDWKVIHVLREANDVADGLAKAGVSRTFDMVLPLQ
ncbi:hypothetical protein REPUB_Repub19eG0110700 [Reevesia pubescens]